MEKRAHAFSKRISILGATALLAACALTAPRLVHAAKSVEVVVPKEATAQGSVFVATVTSTDELLEVSGLFQGHVIEFFPDGEHTSSGAFHRYRALIGVDYYSVPGPVELSVKAKIGNDNIERKTPIAVKEGVFPSEKLRVPPRTIFPSKTRISVRICARQPALQLRRPSPAR
jgi:hypothetical protein